MKWLIGIPLAAYLWLSVLVWAVGDPAMVGWERGGPGVYQRCLNGDRIYSIAEPLSLARSTLVVAGGCR